jgi:hypothetical protein
MTLYGWVLLAMVTWCPTRSLWRFVGYQRVAAAIVAASPDPEDASDLAALASLESGYDVTARGRHAEVGAWQLMPPQPCARLDIDCQAREALSRWKAGACLYTGEPWDGPCPLAHNRADRATIWRAAHPLGKIGS